MVRFLTAGESHGPELSVIVEGLPAGVPVEPEALARALRRRRGGHGRGGRMAIETDEVEISAGVRHGRTIGSPVAMRIANREAGEWAEAMRVAGPRPDPVEARAVTRPRPGHADLAGALKYDTHDARDVLERASARETAARVVAGALTARLLAELGVALTSRTVAVGEVEASPVPDDRFDDLQALPDDAPLRVLDQQEREAMIAAIDAARRAGNSIGGVFEVLARGVPPGIGSHVHWDRRLDGRLGAAILSIQAVKAVAIGEGIEGASRHGSEHHDAVAYDAVRRAFVRPTNRAGGIEGGMSNGEMLRVRGYLKPLATLPRPLPSVDLVNKSPFEAAVERTDTIPVVAAGVVGEAMVAVVLADEMLRKFGGDCVREIRRNLDGYRAQLREF